MGIMPFTLVTYRLSVSIITGPIIANLGWKYVFYIAMPLLVIQTALLILFVPETAYNRSAIYDIDTLSDVDLGKLGELENRARFHEVETINASEKVDPAAPVATSHLGLRPPPPPKTFVQRMALYTGTYSPDSFLKTFLSSILILTNVGASWNIFITGLIVAWYVAVSVVSAELLSAPPYLFDAAGVGYAATGALIGGILGSIFCSLTMDPWQRALTRWNKGV